MKQLTVALFLILSSCASIQKFPSKAGEISSFEYCGGELWGYMLPLGPREAKPWHSKKLDDPMPLLAVYLHMHSDLAQNPAQALMLFVDIRSRTSFSVEIPNPKVEVKIDGLSETRSFSLKFIVVEAMKTAKERFPYPRYDVKLVDETLNKWKITKVNRWLSFLSDGSEIVQLPMDRTFDLGLKERKIQFDGSIEKEIYVRGSENIWPVAQALRNSVISVKVPKIVINGKAIEAQTLQFDMNYQAVKSERLKSGSRPCPSTEFIFRRND